MAVDRDKLAKFLNMLSADDMTALVAVRKIRDMAATEKVLISDLCMTGKVVYQEKIVYRDAAPGRGNPREDVWAEFKKAAEEAERASRARAEQRRQQRQAEQDRKRRNVYGDAFDDAEMSDADREAARARGKRAGTERTLLDEIQWAYDNEDDDLDWREKEFASTVPFQYRYDWELSERQTRFARRIIAKVKRNKGESPI